MLSCTSVWDHSAHCKPDKICLLPKNIGASHHRCYIWCFFLRGCGFSSPGAKFLMVTVMAASSHDLKRKSLMRNCYTTKSGLTIEHQSQTTYVYTCGTTGWQKGNHKSKIGTHKLVQLRVCTLCDTTAHSQTHRSKINPFVPIQQSSSYQADTC